MASTPIYPHPAALDVEILLRDCKCTRTRRGGPGGQHRNKVETAFLIEHTPSGVAAEANERRSLEENRKIAVQRLRVRLAVIMRIPNEPSTQLSDLWQRRQSGGRIDVSQSHADYPAVLAEALDRVAAFDYKIADAAKSLRVTTSALVRLIAKSTDALIVVNKERAARSMPKLRTES